MSTERWATILVLAAAIPIPVLAQTVAVVQGRVIEAGTTSGIQNAIVELEGHGATLTSLGGTFRFEGVEPGGYTLRVEAFGYAPDSRLLTVAGDTTVTIPLEIAPLLLDSVVVETRLIDMRGWVRDRGREARLPDAGVFSNQGRAALTDASGRFRLEDVQEDVPLRVSVMAFGYLPLDTIFVPQRGERYLFELDSDPQMERLIDVQIERLGERASGRSAVLMRSVDRERLLRRRGTVGDLLDFDYPRGYSPGCVVVDEEQLIQVAPMGFVLGTTPVSDIYRIEFLFGGAMMRIYTREFIQTMIASDIELGEPYYIPNPFGEAVCG